MNFSAIELTAVIENRLKNYYSEVKIDETGFVLSVGDGIAEFSFNFKKGCHV